MCVGTVEYVYVRVGVSGRKYRCVYMCRGRDYGYICILYIYLAYMCVCVYVNSVCGVCACVSLCLHVVCVYGK